MHTSISPKAMANLQSSLNRDGVTIAALQDESLRRHVPLADLVSARIHDGLEVNQPSWTSWLRSYLQAIAAINSKHAQFAGFGDKTTDIDYSASHGGGYVQHFQNGSIFYTEAFGAHEVHGAIRDLYAQLGWQNSFLGFPETDELSVTTAGVETRYNNFQGGSIAWTRSGGALVALSLDARVERHQLGAWIHLSGQGFTPGSTVHFSVEGLIGFQGAKATGVTATPSADTRFSDVIWDGRTWPQGGTATIRASDQATNRSATASIPALY